MTRTRASPHFWTNASRPGTTNNRRQTMLAPLSPVQRIIDRCTQLFEDLDLQAVKDWKAAQPGRKAIGYMPVYVPRELIHAAGMLPVGILGGGDALEVIQGDAYYQSYI